MSYLESMNPFRTKHNNSRPINSVKPTNYNFASIKPFFKRNTSQPNSGSLKMMPFNKPNIFDKVPVHGNKGKYSTSGKFEKKGGKRCK